MAGNGDVSDCRPSGTVTFLFTDIVGSTRLWNEQPASMALALRRHDDVLRRVGSRFGGYVFARAGDSFGIAFTDPADAVAAAVAVQRELRAELSDTLPLRVRMGIGTGVADERDGDYFGPALNLVARVMSTAQAGQILVCRSTADLVRRRLPPDVALANVGEVELRDIGSEELAQVLAPGVVESRIGVARFAAVLPADRTMLLGRDGDIKRLTDLLVSERLATVVGPGGSGKTRVAVSTARHLAGDLADGVLFVELAPLRAHSDVANAVAEAADLRSSAAGRDVVDVVARIVGQRELLVVLDNCEHVLDGVADVVEALLDAPGRARVLATSREPLGVDGERVFRLSPLGVGDEDTEGPAVTLLRQRAEAAGAGDAVAHAERELLAGICRRLDGLPLAIELAAAQLAHLGVRELLERLDDRFELLVGGWDRRHIREQTLGAVMEWSWSLLDPELRDVMRTLAVFPAGWTLVDADAVCHDLVGRPVAVALGQLIDKSLVVVSADRTPTRYSMLETVRLYARRSLDDSGLTEDRERRVAEQVLARSSATWPEQALRLDVWNPDCFDDELLWWSAQWFLDRSRPGDAAALVVHSYCAWDRVSKYTAERADLFARTALVNSSNDHDRLVALAALALCGQSLADVRSMESAAREAYDLAESTGALDMACMMIPYFGARLRFTAPAKLTEIVADHRDRARSRGWTALGGFVEVLGAHIELFGGTGDRPFRPDDFGGLGTLGLNVAAPMFALHRALHGHYDEAVDLAKICSEADPSAGGRQLNVAETYAAVEALAGDPAEALRIAVQFRAQQAMRSDVLYTGELCVTAAAAVHRLGDAERALTYLHASKNHTMWFPAWYDVRREIRRRVMEELADDRAVEASRRGRSMTVDDVVTELSSFFDT